MLRLSPKSFGILLGVFYGIFIRVFFEISSLESIYGLVSASFMMLTPFAIGYLTIYFECRVNPKLSVSRSIFLPWLAIFAFLLTTFVTMLEGAICIAMALPIFLLLASIGGWAASLLHKKAPKASNKSVMSIILLPLFITPLESTFIHNSNTYTVSDSIEIAATPEQVWQELASVSEIQANELPFSLNTLIGIPKPIKADMQANGVGAVRVSYWEKGIVFKEKISEWVPNIKMAYEFDIDPDAIPDHALDQHVKMGGEYFSPLFGAYTLTQSANGNTILSLSTTIVDNTNFGIYSRAWGNVIFHDFHQSLLIVMKGRAEKNTQRLAKL